MEGTEWCLFHYPSKAGELVERFTRGFEEERRRQEKEHPEFLDFTGFDFPVEMTFERELQKVSFRAATFRKSVGFSTLDEGSFVFDGCAWFDGATFEGRAGFGGVIFEGPAEFGEAARALMEGSSLRSLNSI